MKPQPGDRVRINDPCVWPARANCLATVVAPPDGRTYPQPAPWEIILRLDDDPLHGTHAGWTCIIAWKAVELVARAPEPR